MNVLNATELYILNWLILCYVNLTSIKQIRERGRRGGKERKRPLVKSEILTGLPKCSSALLVPAMSQAHPAHEQACGHLSPP